MARESLGEFEHQVLLAILHLGGATYSAPIVLEMERRLGKGVAPAAVYIALRRLERRGLLQSLKEAPAPREGGRGRRTFQVTPLALTKLRESRRTFERFWEGLEPVFEDQ